MLNEFDDGEELKGYALFTEEDLLEFLGSSEKEEEKINQKNSNSATTVYLAGPIEKELENTNPHSILWREEALSKFAEDSHTWDVRDPTRHKREKDSEGNWIFKKDRANSFAFNSYYIFSSDLDDIDDSAILIVNLTKLDSLSVGTLFEIGYAYANHKLLIVIADIFLKEHPFIKESANIIVSSVAEAVDACIYLNATKIL